MLIGVVKSDDALSPFMFLYGVNVANITLFQFVYEFVEIVLFEIDFRIVAAEANYVRAINSLKVSAVCKTRPPVNVLFALKSITTRSPRTLL